MIKEFTFKEIYSMSPAERKEKRVSIEIKDLGIITGLYTRILDDEHEGDHECECGENW